MLSQQNVSKLKYSSWHWTEKYVQVVVVSKTRVPSVDDELGINHLGTIKYILLEICQIKDNCLPIPTETDSEVTKCLNWNGKIPLYRESMDFFTKIMKKKHFCEKEFYLFIITEIILSHMSEWWSHIPLHVLLPPVPICFQSIIGTFNFVFKFPNLFWELNINCKH